MDVNQYKEIHMENCDRLMDHEDPNCCLNVGAQLIQKILPTFFKSNHNTCFALVHIFICMPTNYDLLLFGFCLVCLFKAKITRVSGCTIN